MKMETEFEKMYREACQQEKERLAAHAVWMAEYKARQVRILAAMVARVAASMYSSVMILIASSERLSSAQ